MYIKTERNNEQLSMSKISSKTELINEIKTLSNTLSDDIKNEYNITSHQIACHYLTKNIDTIDVNEKNIHKLYKISENIEQYLNKLTIDNPIKIESEDYPYYKLSIELDENSKLKITAASDLDEDFTWDTLIQYFPASEKDEF